VTGAAFNRGNSRQDFGTPRSFLDAFAAEYGPIGFDLAADESTRCAGNWFDEGDDALVQPWTGLGDKWKWLNPPFANIAPWAKKCAAESARGARIAFLVPAAVGSVWYAKHVHNKAYVRPVRPRLSFDGLHGYPKDIMLCLYDGRPGFEPWRWDGKTDGDKAHVLDSVEATKEIVAEVRGRRGRDYIRALKPYGKMLDALDAEAKP